METIRAAGIVRRFGKTVAVDGLSLSVNEGELFGLVGSDGAGKTTTMRLLAGVLDPTEGEVFVLGRSLRTEASAAYRDIGYMSQRFGLYPDLTVMENIDFHADLYGVSRKERAERIPELFAFSGLGPFRDRPSGNLSGGMKQKLGLSCALVHTPRVLFLDEPTNGVDPVSRRDFWRILYRLLREKVTVFVSTAYLDEAERFRRLAFLHEGRLIATGTPESVKAGVAGAVVEVACEAPRHVAARLRDAFGPAAPVGIAGGKVRVVVPGGGDAAGAVDSVLSGGPSGCGPASSVEPTLEDAFMALLSVQEGAAT